MFMNVIYNCLFCSTFKVIQGQLFGSRSSQGQAKFGEIVYYNVP